MCKRGATPARRLRRYFAFLAANGYSLSEVEQSAAGTAKKRRRGARPAAESDDTAA